MQVNQPEASADNSDTPGTFGVPSLTLLVIASMIGVGVFTTSGFTLGSVGTVPNVMLCWGLGGLIALCGAIAYGRLAAVLPESGGEYLFLSRNVHPLAGFLAGWVSLFAGFSGAIATAAVGFEQYAIPGTLRPSWLPADVVAIALILFFGVAHGCSVRGGAWLQNVVVSVKTLALIAFLGFVAVKAPSHVWHWQTVDAGVPNPNLLNSIATSLVWISLSFAGFNAAVYVAGESVDAVRNVPKALVAGTLIVTAIYLVLNFIFVAAASADKIVWQQPVAAIAANALGGRGLETLIRFAVSLGLASSISGMIMTGPRVYAKMSDDGVFPKQFASQNGFGRSIALQCAIAIGLIMVQRLLVAAGLLQSSLLGLFVYLGTTLSISSACCVATLFLPSVRSRSADHSLWIDGVSGLYIVATLGSVALMTSGHEVEGQSQTYWHLSGAAITFVTGIAAWCFLRPNQLRPDQLRPDQNNDSAPV